MTSKTNKTILLAIMLSAILIPVALMGNAEAEKPGKTIIDTQLPNENRPDRAALEALEVAFDNAENDNARENIKAQAERLMEKSTVPFDNERAAKYTAAKDVLVTQLAAMQEDNGEKSIPFTRIGYDKNSDTLHVRILGTSSNEANMNSYANTIRDILGDKIDLKISNGGDYWKSGTCSNGPLNDCSTLESGVEFEVDNHGPCTIGMRASYSGDDGFVTAGHCADDETNSDVGQDTISSVIGTVSKETYNEGSSYETCDCAFIEIDSGSRTMSDDVYWQSYYPTSAADASEDDYVKIYGKSGITYGYVEETCDDIVDDDDTTLKCVVIVDNAAQGGDSGGLVAQTFDATPEFHGIFVAYSTGDESAYVKHGKFTSHFSGLSWDY